MTDTIERVFWIPVGGGGVREGAAHAAEDATVCKGLAHLGATLTARDGADLLRVIRAEWGRYAARPGA